MARNSWSDSRLRLCAWWLTAMLIAGSVPGVARGESADTVAERLKDTLWAIELEPLYGEKPDAPIADTLRFTWTEMTSARFAEEGFWSAAYHITATEDDVPVWEATQLNPEAGIVLWKGHLYEESVRGVVSKQPLKGHSTDFVFFGRKVQQDQGDSEPSAGASHHAGQSLEEE